MLYFSTREGGSPIKILIVEDERLLAASLQDLLGSRGFETEAVYDGEAGAAYGELGVYDLIILDVMLPKLDGWQVARRLREKRCGTPILMLTARADVADRVEGLDAGADYYLTKPFDSRELLACVNALLRRQGEQVDELRFGNTALDLAAGVLICGESRVRLSAREFGVMRHLMHSGERHISKETLLERVWGFESNAVENHVDGLRFLRTGPPEQPSVVFADVSGEGRAMESLVRSCLLIGAGAFLVFLAVSVLLSRWAAGPVERAWEQQRRFVADASHELKTPLTVILTNAELLQNPAQPPEARERFGENILTMARQMRSLVESLLELARAEGSLREESAEPVDLSRLLADALLPFEPVLFEGGLELECHIQEGISVRGSARRLEQVLGILLDNAAKYAAPPGTVTVRLERTGGRRCLLSVSSPGTALTEAQRRDIFRRFVRGDPARSRDGGFGLGLSIAQEIVRAHRGTIWAESGGEGNTFCIQFPVLRRPREG